MMNCCLFDVNEVLSGGFEMGNIWYNEPKTLDVAFDVIGDIVLVRRRASSTVVLRFRAWRTLAPYAEKSYGKYIENISTSVSTRRSEGDSLERRSERWNRGFQGWEYKFNSVSSSRIDYPIITMTAGHRISSRFAEDGDDPRCSM